MRLSASIASVSASALTSAAVARASVVAPATRRMASEPLRASLEARLTPSVIEATALVLLLDRNGDCRCDRRHFLDDAVDLLDGLRGVGDRGLDRAHLTRDFLGRLGGLAGERLDLRGDDGKAAAGVAGARGLDRGIERQKVGLPGDGLDQANDLTDTGRGIAELRHGVHGATCFFEGAGSDLGRAVGLASDLPDRGGEFLYRARGRGDISRRNPHARLGGPRLGGNRIGSAVELASRSFRDARPPRAPSASA